MTGFLWRGTWWTSIGAMCLGLKQAVCSLTTWDCCWMWIFWFGFCCRIRQSSWRRWSLSPGPVTPPSGSGTTQRQSSTTHSLSHKCSGRHYILWAYCTGKGSRLFGEIWACECWVNITSDRGIFSCAHREHDRKCNKRTSCFRAHSDKISSFHSNFLLPSDVQESAGPFYGSVRSASLARKTYGRPDMNQLFCLCAAGLAMYFCVDTCTPWTDLYPPCTPDTRRATCNWKRPTGGTTECQCSSNSIKFTKTSWVKNRHASMILFLLSSHKSVRSSTKIASQPPPRNLAVQTGKSYLSKTSGGSNFNTCVKGGGT